MKLSNGERLTRDFSVDKAYRAGRHSKSLIFERM